MERFWVYLDNKVQGPVEIPALRKMTGFNLLTQVCAEGQESWRMADEVIEIKAYFAAPPRVSSLTLENQPDLNPVEKTQIEMPIVTTPVPSASRALPPVGVAGGAALAENAVVETIEEPVPAAGPAAAGGLRLGCAACGYKNPRDVAACMKCGSQLKAAAAVVASKPPISLSALADTLSPVAETATPAPATPLESPMVEIPVVRIAIIVGVIGVAGVGFIMGRQAWQRKHTKHVALHPMVVRESGTATRVASNSRKPETKAHRGRAAVALMPGLRPSNTKKTPPVPEPKVEPSPVPPKASAPARKEPDEGAPASYSVINEAYPLKHRTAAPVDSPFAVKRRGDRGLWSTKEGQAIQKVQGHRIYGGTRTILRNADILMQILRDREYSSAFESGKRIYLFNDADWAASQAQGPVYEVRLTFSGGKEADGSPRSPLRFAFNVDMERQTVEVGGTGLIRSNTMHAFFDESRIPPEERRAIARDTEELVKAAQPDASPLALDTVSRHYAETYSAAALTRVADAYGLTLVNKKLAHQTASLKEVLPESALPAKTASYASNTAKSDKLIASASGDIRYTMEKGEGKERVIHAIAPSHATPGKLWETLTTYDRLTQYVPDMLTSQREGQDGSAIIVHTVSLSRLMFFVFKTNLHLRILEHPQQHRIEFERIAGDFEKFAGSIEINPDPTGTRSTIELRLSLAPKGSVPQWAVRRMAQRFVVPVLDAVRAKAEAN